MSSVRRYDQSLYIPDFRSPERTFQLITQAAGRAGRGDLKGAVLIQSFSPFNDTLRFAVRNASAGFYCADMEARELLGYPPAGHLIVIHLQGVDAAAGAAYAAELIYSKSPHLAIKTKSGLFRASLYQDGLGVVSYSAILAFSMFIMAYGSPPPTMYRDSQISNPG